MPRKREMTTYRKVLVPVDTLDPDQAMIQRVGQALYGEFWQSPLARELGLVPRSVQRWSAGMFRVAPERWPQLLRLLERKRLELERLEADVLAYSEQRSAAE